MLRLVAAVDDTNNSFFINFDFDVVIDAYDNGGLFDINDGTVHPPDRNNAVIFFKTWNHFFKLALFIMQWLLSDI